MATTAAAYRNSDDSGSAKERPFFTVAEIENFFATCPSELLGGKKSRRFRHFLRGVWIAAGRPFGAEIQFFKAIDDYREACEYRSASTARYNLRESEDMGLLEIAHRDHRGNCHHIWIRKRTDGDRGLYRRVTTHRLPVSLLLRWREMHRAERQAEVTPIRKPAAPAQPLPPAPAAPLPKREKPAAEEKQPQPKLTKRDCDKFMGLVAGLKLGRTRHVDSVGGYGYDLKPEDPRYSAPMKELEAIRTVCKAWRRELEVVLYALKFWGYQVETEGEA